MAIQDILNKLLSEPRMDNMRQTIVDGLNQVYKDATFDGNTNMEVLRSRGSSNSLNDRLDGMSAQQTQISTELSQKASINYVDAILMDIAKGGPNSGPQGPFMSLAALYSYNFPDGKEGTWLVFDTSFGDGAHSFMWDSTNATWKDLGVYQATGIPDGTITTKKIANEAVTAEKTPFFDNLISKNRLDELKITSGKYMGDGGSIGEGNYGYTDYIEVSEGDIIVGSSTNKNTGVVTQTSFRFVAAFTENKAVLGYAGSTSPVLAHTILKGVKYVVLSSDNYTSNHLKSNRVQIERTSNGVITSYEPFFVDKYELSDEYVGEKKEEQSSFSRNALTLNSGEYMSFEPNAIKKNKNLSFTARITSFNSLRIGHGESLYGASYFDINNTTINIYNYTTDEILSHSWEHGLVIKDYITVLVVVDNESVVKIRITTNGGEYETVSGWNGYNGPPFVKSIGSVLKSCSLSWDCADFNKPIFAFGDSYFNLFETARWPYYIRTFGFDNWLLNGFPGQDSASAYTMMLNIIEQKKPKYILWALGMNNGDNGAVNATWNRDFNSLKSICKKYDIELVPCTIPSVPNISHVYKNAVVISSGLRYIDFEKAVGADISTSWYSGMLSSDLVHPDVAGAKALAYRALLDFPELARS